MADSKPSLADAKMFENIPKYHIVRNFPRNIA